MLIINAEYNNCKPEPDFKNPLISDLESPQPHSFCLRRGRRAKIVIPYLGSSILLGVSTGSMSTMDSLDTLKGWKCGLIILSPSTSQTLAIAVFAQQTGKKPLPCGSDLHPQCLSLCQGQISRGLPAFR